MEPIYWLIVLAVLLLIEIFTLGLTTIWFAGGAMIAFFASLLGVNEVIQIVLFFTISLLLLFFTRPLALRYFNKQRTITNSESLIGKEAKVTETIDNDNQVGTVIVNGLEWTARSSDNLVIEQGTKVIIKEITGVKLIVTKNREEK